MNPISNSLIATFEEPISFSCLPGCGLCCSYKIHVNSQDIERIKSVGLENVAFQSGCLAKKEGFCQFLNNDKKCDIYQARPQYCKTFPFYFENMEEVDIDLSCPGIGQGHPISQDELFKLYVDYVNINKPQYRTPPWQDLLTLYGGFDVIDHKSFTEIGMKWCRENHPTQNLSELANKAMQFAKLQSVTVTGVSVGLKDFFNINDLWNIHMQPPLSPLCYQCQLSGEEIVLNGNKYNLGDISDNLIKPESSDYLIKYLSLWFRRNLFYNFCMASCLAQAPMIDSALNVAFLFVTGLIQRISQVRQVLKNHWTRQGEVTNDLELLKESVRLFDGRLRTKCRAICVQTCKLT